jgi:2-(1,2-epoxy-1,2-dihydrophenyl)acetyl-CoA isomerase
MAFSKLGLVRTAAALALPRVADALAPWGWRCWGQTQRRTSAGLGMIWQVVDDEQLSATAQQMALHFASQPTFGLGLIKQAINAAETNTLDAQLDLERDYQRLAGRSDDYREGVSAFLAKRAPNFTGK